MRWNRSNNQFEEWSGSVWSPKILAIAGGGTGSSTVAGARGALGLGTIAVQNANAIAVTGGNLSGVSFSGNIGFSGGIVTMSGIASNYAVLIQNSAAPASGLNIRAGTGSASEYPLAVQNASGTINGLVINGAMTAFFTTRLVIPVGANFWA